MRDPLRPTTLEERLLIMELATRGWNDARIAAEVGRSVATIRKWRTRGKEGRHALASRMGRPRGSLVPHTRRERAIRTQVLRWREEHPGWGPKTLHAELARDPQFAAGPLPSRATL